MCAVAFSGSLKVMFRIPMLFENVANVIMGRVSFTVMDWSDATAICLPDGSRTAPWPMSSCGITMAFTLPVSASDRSNVM